MPEEICMFWNWRVFSLAYKVSKKPANFKINKFLQTIQSFKNCLYSRHCFCGQYTVQCQKPINLHLISFYVLESENILDLEIFRKILPFCKIEKIFFMDLRFRNWTHIQTSFRLKNHHAISSSQARCVWHIFVNLMFISCHEKTFKFK